MRLYIVRNSSNVLNHPLTEKMAVFSTLELAIIYCDKKNISQKTILGVELNNHHFGLFGEVAKIDD